MIFLIIILKLIIVKVKLFFMDIDSLCYEIEIKDVYKEF